jgi:hypothetical protein
MFLNQTNLAISLDVLGIDLLVRPGLGRPFIAGRS